MDKAPHRPSQRHKRTVRCARMDILVFLCFLLSGGSGLLFEVLWTRELQLVFGSTTLAMSTVLSVFMGGLALGSLIGGKLAPKVKRPLFGGCRPLRAAAAAGPGPLSSAERFFVADRR